MTEFGNRHMSHVEIDTSVGRSDARTMSEKVVRVRCPACSELVEVGDGRSHYISVVHYEDGRPSETTFRVRDTAELLHRCLTPNPTRRRGDAG
jgi:hypothetical protein